MISVTEAAQKKIIQSIDRRRKGVGIRIGVKTTGCSGLAYVLEYLDDDKFDPHSEKITFPGFVIIVSLKDIVYLRGLEVDYAQHGLNEGFEFRNPNERDRCGCGESFRV